MLGRLYNIACIQQIHGPLETNFFNEKSFLTTRPKNSKLEENGICSMLSKTFVIEKEHKLAVQWFVMTYKIRKKLFI